MESREERMDIFLEEFRIILSVLEITREHVADVLGVTRFTVYNWMTGKTKPDYCQFCALMEWLDYTLKHGSFSAAQLTYVDLALPHRKEWMETLYVRPLKGERK